MDVFKAAISVFVVVMLGTQALAASYYGFDMIVDKVRRFLKRGKDE